MQRAPQALWASLLLLIFPSPSGAGLPAPVATLPEEGGVAGEVQSFLEDAGLTRRRIFDLAFEKDGTGWFAASDGLYRYDGYVWQRFTQEEHGLPMNFVRSVAVIRSGEVWVGTQQGAGIIRPRAGASAGAIGTPDSVSWVFDPVAPPERMAGPSVRRIVEDRDGTLWFCNDAWPSSRSRFGLSSLSTAGVWRNYGKEAGLTAHPLCYFRAGNGDQFVGIQGRSALLQKQGEQWLPTASPETMYWSVVEHPSMGMLARGGREVVQFRDGRGTALDGESPIHPLLVLDSGELLTAIITPGGALSIGRWTGSAFEALSPPLSSESAVVEEMRQAPDGAVWVVGDNLLARWDRSPTGWRRFPTLPLPAGKAALGPVWFASGDRTVCLQAGKFTRHEDHAGAPAIAPDGILWRCSSYAAASFRADTLGSRFLELETFAPDEMIGCVPGVAGTAWFYSMYSVVYSPPEEPPQAVPVNLQQEIIGSAALDPKGKLWLLILKNEQDSARVISAAGELHSVITSFSSHFYESKLHISRHGTFWIYGTKGLYRCESGSSKWERIEAAAGTNITTHLETEDAVWFAFDARGGGQGGIGFFENGRWSQRLCDVTGAAAAASNGDLYFSGEKSLFVVPKGRLADLFTIGIPDRVRATKLLSDHEGRLWLGGNHREWGETTYCYISDQLAPRVHFLGKPADATEGGTLRVMATGVERFRTQGSGRDFRFSWRLPGLEWSSFEALPAGGIPVGGISPGTHQLELRCVDDDGDRSRPTPLSFTVLPLPLQMKPWFRPAVTTIFALVALLAAAAIYAAVRIRGANLKLQIARTELQAANLQLEERVDERTVQLTHQIAARESAEVRFGATLAERNRLARELHDTLEQGLAGVRLQIESARMSSEGESAVGRALTVASEILRFNQTEVRRSIHNLRSETLEQFDLPTAFAVACKHALHASDVDFQVSTTGEPRRYAATVENGLLRIGQEAVTNAVKHARATRISVEFVFEPEQLLLSINDDGIGFDPKALALQGDGHFGILGMKERAERLGAELLIESSASGTKLAVLFRAEELLHMEDD